MSDDAEKKHARAEWERLKAQATEEAKEARARDRARRKVLARCRPATIAKYEAYNALYAMKQQAKRDGER
jgi:hypothetical protein